MKSISKYIVENINNLILEAVQNKTIGHKNILNDFKDDPDYYEMFKNEFVIGGKCTWFDSAESMIKAFAENEIYSAIIYRFLGKEHWQNTYNITKLKQNIKNQSSSSDLSDKSDKEVNEFIKFLKEKLSRLLSTQGKYNDFGEFEHTTDYSMNIKHIINTICVFYSDEILDIKENSDKLKEKLSKEIGFSGIYKKLCKNFLNILFKDIYNCNNIIKECYYKFDKIKDQYNSKEYYKYVPFVIKANMKGSHNIYIRSNIDYHKDIRDIFSHNEVSDNHINKLFKDLHYGFGRSKGVDFENNLYSTLKKYFLMYKHETKLNNITPITEAEKTALSVIKQLLDDYKSQIKTMIENITEDNIDNFIVQTGSKNTKRNKEGKIIGAEFDLNENILNDSGFNDNLEESGYEISDITIQLNGEENKNKDIYLSVKYKEAQFSGIAIKLPFYPDGKYGIQNFEEFFDTKEVDNIEYYNTNLAFKNLCTLFNINETEEINNLLDYFKNDKDKREGGGNGKKEKIKLYSQKSIRSKNVEITTSKLNDRGKMTNNTVTKTVDIYDILNRLITQIIGGNYYYVNVDKILRMPSEYDVKNLPFEIDNRFECYLTPSSIRLVFKLKFNKTDKNIIGQLVFRSTQKNMDYPYRLFVKFGNKQPGLYDDNSDLDDNFAEHNSEILNELFNSNGQLNTEQNKE
jgi:hypothetical protein